MFSIRINGRLVFFFPYSRGATQGDPLSPLLFCLAEEVHSRGIFNLVNDKKILHIASPQGYLTPSHILYVDDIFVFCRADNKSFRNLSIYLKHMVIFLVNMLIILRVVFSPWIILQDLSPKFNVFFLVVMVVCLSLI